MSFKRIASYPRVIILFEDGEYTEYTPGNLVDLQDVMDAQLILAFDKEGNVDILKNRWGEVTC